MPQNCLEVQANKKIKYKKSKSKKLNTNQILRS